MESVIFSSPLALILYGIALFLCLFDLHYKLNGPIFPILSAVFALAAAAYSLLIGASLWECAAILLIFLLLNMGVRE